jgi:hypothetical protein
VAAARKRRSHTIEGSLPAQSQLRRKRRSFLRMFVVLEESKLDFQVNSETYFLSLAENERQWLVHVSTPTGIRQIPVYVDEALSDDVTLVIEDKDKHKIVN